MRKMRVRGYRSAGFMTLLTIGCHSFAGGYEALARSSTA